MAKGAGRSEKSKISHAERHANGDPPPSTYAAQIVDKFTSARRRPHPSDNEALRQLLRMILDADHNGKALPGGTETNIEVNYRLVYTIVRAGLEVLFSSSPFEDRTQVQVQACDTLAVVNLTIRRSPEVLFCTSETNDPIIRPGGPLFLWLVPHLVNLFRYDMSKEITEVAEKALRTALSVQSRTSTLRTRLHPVLRYLQGCITDLLNFIEASQLGKGDIDPYRVPTNDTIGEVSHHELPNINDQAMSRIYHEDLSVDAYIVVSLILVILTAKSGSTRPSISTSADSSLTWTVDCLIRIWYCVKPAEESLFSSLARVKADSIESAQVAILLCQCTTSFLQSDFEELSLDLENEICWSVYELLSTGSKSPSILTVYREYLSVFLHAEDDPYRRIGNFHADLQRTLALAVHYSNGGTVNGTVTASSQELLNFDDSSLGQEFRRLLQGIDNVDVEPRPSKRVRLSDISNEVADGPRREGLGQLYDVLGLSSADSLEDVHNKATSRFPTLCEKDQCKLFIAIGQTACTNAQTWSLSRNQCSTCDFEQQKQRSTDLMEEKLCQQLISTVTSLLPYTQRLVKPRIVAMMCIKRLLSHTGTSEDLDLKASFIGQWCLEAMRRSSRDLRIAAGRTLIVFLQDGVDKGILRQNRILALDTLRSLSEKAGPALQETCVLTWGRIATISSEDETNIALLRLLDYLGHANPLISGVAYDELLKLSGHAHVNARRIFEPYWRTIAVTVVKDLQTRPQIAQLVCDLLNLSVPQFLQQTQFFTIPYLALTKKREVLQRVAESCGPEHSVKSLCMGHDQLAAILSYLLLQPWEDMENMVMSLLCHASPEFKDVNLEELIKSAPMLTGFELLKVAGEEEEGKTARVHRAIQLLASFSQRGVGHTRGSGRRSGGVGNYFEQHVLAIMALLSDIISEKSGFRSLSERKRCIGAIREMIRLAGSHVCNALPQVFHDQIRLLEAIQGTDQVLQICACLQSAIEAPELCNEAFNVWIVLLITLGEEDVKSLINATFAIIAQHWKSFDPIIQERTYDMISLLLNTHSGMVREMVNTIPSIQNIPLLSKFETELGKLKAQMDPKHQFQAFSTRCQDENSIVVLRALTELDSYLLGQQSFLHASAISEQPDPVISQLIRSLLDACVRFSEGNSAIAILCAKCLGSIGCVDPTRIEALRDNKDIIVLSNFERADETIDFVIFFFQEVLVKAFLSATDTRAQSYLGYVIQELLRFCDFDSSLTLRSGDNESSTNYRRWIAIPESIRNTLTPFLTSKYFLTAAVSLPEYTYPLYNIDAKHSKWLRDFVFDLLRKGCGENAAEMFPVCRRAIRTTQDLSIPTFLLPFAALNVVVGGTQQQKLDVAKELLAVLSQTVSESNQTMRNNMILCSQNVFQTLDYFSRWILEKKKEMAQLTLAASRSGRALPETETAIHLAQVNSVQDVLTAIPAQIMSRRAVECRSYSRALFYWEQYIREQRQFRSDTDDGLEQLYEKLQDIYTQIDEPDGIEGISSHLQVLNIDQQILEHRKAGRWTAVQSWYELRLTEEPNDTEVQFNLLTCLKESGQYDVLLNQISGLSLSKSSTSIVKPFAVEASWVTGKWDKLIEHLTDPKKYSEGDFNVGIASALVALHNKDFKRSKEIIDELRYNIAKSMSMTTTTSLQACHESSLKFHILTEVEAISGVGETEGPGVPALLKSLNQRLDVLGAFLPDKQYLLGLRRAAMQLSRHDFSKLDISSAWLTSARLARKGNFIHQAFNAVLHASQLEDESATIEHSRLLWKEGHHRKAIQSLEGAIAANAFRSHDYIPMEDVNATTQQNILTARAHLLLAKWIDQAGQTQSDAIIRRYRKAVEFHNRWEKGHYYLGKHYNKLLESEKVKPPARQAQTFITGETAKLVIENYVRSLAYGAKYIYQTLPRILTLWLDLGNDVDTPLDPKYGNDENFRTHAVAQRRKLFAAANSQVKKYIDRLPPFVFYTAFAQIVARICHSNQTIYASLVDIIAKVVITHPQQALWTLLALIKSSAKERAHRGAACMTKIIENAKKIKTEAAGSEVRTMMAQGRRLSDQLLNVCEGEIQGKDTHTKLKFFGFDHQATPCRLVIPLESTLTVSLPTVTDNINMRTHKAFSKETVTISKFCEDVLVLNSLQRPRKINIVGSDGRVYGLLCKPKDDLRKDQRLMEFNAMINRSLKRDAQCSKRRLYIKTYAVTPLNEECGLIEWVDNLKTLRDILLRSYKQRNVPINYGELRIQLDEACSDISHISVFTDKILSGFPPIFHEWFVEMFPEPSAWFTARLKYTRSCAVMSIVGHVLGLGDRHGENILFEEGNGGTFHVDFNCLFDKGLTFEKPELVPFRLTHNMVDAFGAYGYDGPFRKSCELTLQILRQNEDTLMTILETFLYDPTTDFIGKKKRNKNVPETPEGVLESVKSKVRCLLPAESVPLSVEGYVDELIHQATDPVRLASMYIGWCAFF